MAAFIWLRRSQVTDPRAHIGSRAGPWLPGQGSRIPHLHPSQKGALRYVYCGGRHDLHSGEGSPEVALKTLSVGKDSVSLEAVFQ